MVIDAKGRVIAYPSDNWLVEGKEGCAAAAARRVRRPRRLTRVYDRLKVEGYGRKLLEVGNRRIVGSSRVLRRR